MAAGMDPDVLIRTDPRWPEQRAFGREAAIAWTRGLWESWGPAAEVEELVDLGDRLLVRWCYVTRGQHSGIEGEFRTSALSTYREGRVILLEYFFEHERALEALEMRE
jgi:ketosteroid isomerase-like protein